MVIKNCPNCGGEHWGSLKCPLLPEELAKKPEPWPSLPKRDVPALIEALRIRALALTGERWERNATRDMMKEAAQVLEDRIAYMPVPRCETCGHWKEARSGVGWCNVKRDKIQTTPGANLVTSADFGCTVWKEKNHG